MVFSNSYKREGEKHVIGNEKWINLQTTASTRSVWEKQVYISYY